MTPLPYEEEAVRINNFGLEDQLQTNVPLDEGTYTWAFSSDEVLQVGFDWEEITDSNVVYLQGVDENLMDGISEAIEDDEPAQKIIDLKGEHEDFSDE